MTKKLNLQEFTDLVKKMIIKEIEYIKEYYDEDEDLGNFTDFDADEFQGDAMKAAKADIEKSGDIFEPIGKNKYEKNLNKDEFIKNIERAKLNLPKDKEELKNIKKGIDTKNAHEKRFGAGSMNESVLNTKFKDKPYQMYFSKDNIRSAVGDKSVQGLLKYAKTNNLNNFEIFKNNPKFHSTTQDEYLIYWKGDNSYYDNRSKKEPELLNKKYTENTINENLNKPLDAQGNTIGIKDRVEDLDTKSIGLVQRLGNDDKGKLTVHINWISNFGEKIPKSITYPDKIVIKKSFIAKNESEIEEGMGHSETIGHGQNAKPVNYPKSLTKEIENMNESYNIKKIKKLFENAENKTKVIFYIEDDGNALAVFPDEFESDDKNKVACYAHLGQHSICDTLYFRNLKQATEKEYTNLKKELEGLGYNLNVLNKSTDNMPYDDTIEENIIKQTIQIPEELKKYYVANSIKEINNDNEHLIEYKLRIPKQSDETLNDITKFVKEEEFDINANKGEQFKKVNIQIELEKISNTWLIDVFIKNGIKS